MITPTPTTRIPPTIARGVFGGTLPAAGTGPVAMRLLFPGTSYDLHLVPRAEVTVEEGKRIEGIIAAEARRVDVVGTGGRFVEPVYGRPRRVQGMVVGVADGRLVVNCGMPIHLTLTDPRQRPEQFEPGVMVACDVLDGATFTPWHGE